MNRISITAVVLAILTIVVGCGGNGKTKVPDVRGTEEAIAAYDSLRNADLRVSSNEALSYTRTLIPEFVGPTSVNDWMRFSNRAFVKAQIPAAGRTVADGSTALIVYSGTQILHSGDYRCPSYPSRAPSLIGKTLSWIDAHETCFSITAAVLPRLDAAGKPHLLDNYVVSKQSPAAGSPLWPISASNLPGFTRLTVQVTVSKP